MIFDKYSKVRILARSIVVSLNENISFRKNYLEALSTKTAISIYGLGEVGTFEDCYIIERYLIDSCISVIRAAMTSLMRLNSKEFVSCITDMLSSKHTGVVKTAKFLLEEYRIYDFDRIFEIQKTSDCENTKIKCASLLFLASKWKSLIYLLTLIGSSYERLEALCQSQLNKWISSYNHSYQLASQEEKEIIRSLIIMKENILNSKIQKQLMFLLK